MSIVATNGSIFGRIKYSDNVALESDTFGRILFTNKVSLENPSYGRIKYQWIVNNWMKPTFGRINYSQPCAGFDGGYVNYFDSIYGGEDYEPLEEELKAFFACEVKVNGEYVDIKKVGAIKFRYGINQPPLWSIKLNNVLGTFDDILEDDIITLEYKVFFGNSAVGVYTIDDLIVSHKSGDIVMQIGGTNQACKKLYDKLTLDTYTWKECLLPVFSSKSESQSESEAADNVAPVVSYSEFTSFTLGVHPAKFGEQIYVNAQPVASITTVDDRLTVIKEKPIPCHWLIKDLCSNAGVECVLNFPDFPIRTNIPVQSEQPIRIIEQICSIIPANWYVNKAGKLIIDKIKNETSPVTKYSFNEKILREKANISNNKVKTINTQTAAAPAETLVKTNFTNPVTTEGG